MHYKNFRRCITSLYLFSVFKISPGNVVPPSFVVVINYCFGNDIYKTYAHGNPKIFREPQNKNESCNGGNYPKTNGFYNASFYCFLYHRR